MIDQVPTVTVHKVVRASIQNVFDAWIKPELRKQWWAASSEHECTICEIDASVGGQYRLGMNKGDQDWIVGGEFLAIDAPNKLQFTWTWEHDPSFGGDSIVTVHFNEIELEGEAATELILAHEKLAAPIMRSEHNHGWAGCLHSLGMLFGTVKQCD